MALTFETGIWRATIDNFKSNIAVVSLVVGLALVMTILGELGIIKSASAANFIWIFLAIAAHSSILNGQSGFLAMTGKKGILWNFAWRGMLFGFAGLIGLLIALPMMRSSAVNSGNISIFALLGYGVVQSIVLAKWGTWLPAVVADGDRTFSTAGKRGSSTFYYVLGRLLGCSALVWLAWIVVVLMLSYLVPETLQGPQKIAPSYALDFHELLIDMIFLVAFAFQTVLLATTLSRAYLMAEEKLGSQQAASQ